jgi:hypothetical protein
MPCTSARCRVKIFDFAVAVGFADLKTQGFSTFRARSNEGFTLAIIPHKRNPLRRPFLGFERAKGFGCP